jgi:hypothetical protein
MSVRFGVRFVLPAVMLAALSGCANGNLYWGPALSTCGGPGSVSDFAKEACRNGAEYDVARKKTKRSLAEGGSAPSE